MDNTKKQATNQQPAQTGSTEQHPEQTVASSMGLQKEVVTAINKRVMNYKLLCANLNKDENKVNIGLLDYRSLLSNGHFDVMALEVPILKFYVSLEELPQVSQLLKTAVMSDVYCVVSGSDKYMKLHKILTKNEFDAYRSLITN